MDARTLFESLSASFERLLRIFYPGLLFWIVLPAVLPAESGWTLRKLSLWTDFYSDLSVWAHLGLMLAAGLFIYLIERYFVHELLLLGTVLFPMNVGASANFAQDKQGKQGKRRPWTYPGATARLLWVRFGMRPQDNLGPEGEKAEDRFDRYMAARMAWVHSLGSTWLVLLLGGVVSLFVGDAPLHSLGGWYRAAYATAFAIAAFAWGVQAWIAAQAEQAHYRQPDSAPQ